MKETITLKKEEVPEQPALVEIVMDLAPASGGAIVHNGMMYINRGKYSVTQAVANDLMEIQRRGWAHEASLKENENKNRRNNRAFV